MLETALALVLTSTAFSQGAPIPKVHTCQGSDTSVPRPPKSFKGAGNSNAKQ